MTFAPRALPRTLLVSSAAFLALAALAFAQTSTPRNRVVGPIDESDVVTLTGNTHPLARPANDRGTIADETRLERMVLLLAPSAEQQKALDELTEEQQEPTSAMYHQWLTPEEYGSRFGASANDTARIAGWLAGHGFAVEPLPAGRRSIVFSGTAAQVADTFHTGMHRYDVEGAAHIANAQDPQVPRTLAAVVSGVLSLNDFRRQSAIRSVRTVAAPSGARPQNTQGGTHYIFPADFAAIYDLNPQYSAGNNGAGASIAIVGRSNINLSDVSSFRSYSALAANQPTVVLDGANPGLVSGDQDESTLDVEWSGGVAPGAAVTFVVAGSTSTTDGVDLSAQYIVNHKTATTMSTSYGSCEAYMGSGELSFYNSLWQQAASEGISAFVSSGDSGAAGCNSGSSSSGSMTGVNGLCSSPYSTCVGGTEFNEGSGSYWSGSNGTGGESALSYIPEKVWNESGNDGGSGLWASTGGVSIAYPQPSWQAGVPGANSNGMRAVPDVALTAASHDGYLICENGSWWVIAGTSAASPSFAGIMSMVNEKVGGTGQGNANPALYGMLEAAQNPFHATPSGNNSVPGVTGFTASGQAYNLATGLGSVDGNLLIDEWAGGGSGTTNSGFALQASASSESLLPGKSATFKVSVTGTGGFNGTVALKATAPSGVSVSLSPASVKAGASATATITVSSGAAASNGSITITGTSGSIVATASVPMTVLAKPTLAISASAARVTLARGTSVAVLVTVTTGGAFAGTVSLAAAGMPTGVTASWSNGSYTPNSDGSTVSTLTLHATTAALLTSAAITIRASGDGLSATTGVTMQVTAAPAVTLVLSPASVSMTSMGTAKIMATATPVGGVSFASVASSTAFTVKGLPGGITGTWSAAALTAGGALQAQLTLSGSASAIASTTSPTISMSATDAASGKAFSASQSATLAVSHVAPSLKVNPASAQIKLARGQSVTVKVTASAGGSFAGVVCLNLSGLPAGVSAAWSEQSFTVTRAGSTVVALTLKASSTAAVASTALRITASGDAVKAQTSTTVQIAPVA